MNNFAFLGTGRCEEINGFTIGLIQWILIGIIPAAVFIILVRKNKLNNVSKISLLLAVTVITSVVFFFTTFSGACRDNGSGVWLFGVDYRQY